ncbi:MAG: type II secretion system protein [Planctomycetota bacterium]
MCVARPNLCGWWDAGKVRARGFTIIEIMLTIGILALIAGLILPTFSSWRREAAFDSGKAILADSIAQCANLSQRDGVARVLVAEVATSGLTRLLVQQLRAESQGEGGNAGSSGGDDASGDENVPKGTVLVELGVGLHVVVGEAGDTKSKSDAGEEPVQIALCVAMPDGMIRRPEGTIRLTQSDGTVTVTATMNATPGGAPTLSQGTIGLLRSSVMSIDEFTGRVSWRDEEINKTEGTPLSKPEGGKSEGGDEA